MRTQATTGMMTKTAFTTMPDCETLDREAVWLAGLTGKNARFLFIHPAGWHRVKHEAQNDPRFRGRLQFWRTLYGYTCFMEAEVLLVERLPWDRPVIYEQLSPIVPLSQLQSGQLVPETIVSLAPGAFPETGFVFGIDRDDLRAALARVRGVFHGQNELTVEADALYAKLARKGKLDIAALGWPDVLELALLYQRERGLARLEAAERLEARLDELFDRRR